MSVVAVVTDSTCYLPPGVADRHGITVVPLQVVLGGRPLLEGRDVFPTDLAAALGSHVAVSTSRPTTAEFARIFQAVVDAGAPGIVSVHLSGDLSGTVDAARLAAADVAVPIAVVDSRSTAMGLGFAVLAAAEATAEGADVAEAAARARLAAAATSVLFCVDTLEYLRRGGRIGAAAALLGAALSIKPILSIRDGRIDVAEKVRTTVRAARRLGDLAVALADGPVDAAVHHLAAPDRAAALSGRLRAEVPELVDLYVSEVGPTVAAHTGPGMVGVVICRRDR
jgi:DegV family protein with EDD domain